MLRVSFGARIGLIIVLSVTLAWLFLILYLFRANPSLGDGERSPERILALVETVEQAPPMLRPFIFRAVASESFETHLDRPEERRQDTDASVRLPELEEDYRRVLAPRPVMVRPGPAALYLGRWWKYSPIRPAMLRFEIRLKSGDWLIVEARAPQILTSSGLPIGLGAGLFGTAIAVLALYVMHRETRPLAELAAAVDRLDLDGTISLLSEQKSSAPEIRVLIQAYNRLQTRLSVLMQTRMALIGGISHDVRTFATRLRLRMDLITEETERARAIADIEDMIRLLDDALLSSRSAAGELDQELVDLDDLVEVEVADRRISGSAITYETKTTGASVQVLGDRLALRRILANLIDNAQKYGRIAHVALESAERTAVLMIDDEGPGIPAAQRAAMLEPFSRLESSRSRSTGGAGLGLAIVNTLVGAMGGSFSVDDAPSGGTRVMVKLPVFLPDKESE